MTGVFYVTLRYLGGGSNTEEEPTQVEVCRIKFFRRPCRESNPRSSDHEPGALATELHRPPSKNTSRTHNSVQILSDSVVPYLQTSIITRVSLNLRMGFGPQNLSDLLHVNTVRDGSAVFLPK